MLSRLIHCVALLLASHHHHEPHPWDEEVKTRVVRVESAITD